MHPTLINCGAQLLVQPHPLINKIQTANKTSIMYYETPVSRHDKNTEPNLPWGRRGCGVQSYWLIMGLNNIQVKIDIKIISVVYKFTDNLGKTYILVKMSITQN